MILSKVDGPLTSIYVEFTNINVACPYWRPIPVVPIANCTVLAPDPINADIGLFSCNCVEFKAIALVPDVKEGLTIVAYLLSLAVVVE